MKVSLELLRMRRLDLNFDEGTVNLFIVKFLSVLALLTSMSASVAAQSAAKPAPNLYVTRNFGLMMKVPAGMSFCALPKNWSGVEEGTVLFLEKPSSCLPPGGSSVMRPISGFVPSITLRYHANRSRNDAYDGSIPQPLSSEEFAQQFCAGSFVSPDLKLFDQGAFTCRNELPDNKVRIALMAVFNSARNNMILILQTTSDRLTNDTQMLGKVASSIAACQASSGKGKRAAVVCPKGNWW